MTELPTLQAALRETAERTYPRTRSAHGRTAGPIRGRARRGAFCCCP
jgi:hypothetical protein